MEDEKKLTIRIPDELHRQLTKSAKTDTRSLNAEIIVLLREALSARAHITKTTHQ